MKDEKNSEEIEKNNNGGFWKNIVIVILLLVIVVLVVIMAFNAGKASAGDDNKNESDIVEETQNYNDVVEETQNDNTISNELRVDLDKKVSLTAHFIGTGLYTDSINNVIAENYDAYPYFAELTYEYYVYRTGITIDKWSTSDKSYGPCYEDGQNGYCYPINKEDILKYEKELYNIGLNVFDSGEGYSLVKGNKVYVTEVPFNGFLKVEQKSVVSVIKNNDVIEYTATYVVSSYSDDETENKYMTIKYIFKTNEDGNYYLYSFEKV